MAGIFDAVVTGIISVIFITNITIVITIAKTKSFNRSTKFHLSVLTICDFLTGLFIAIKVLLEENGHIIPLELCKVIMGLIITLANVMCSINISMTIECMSMISVTGILSKLRFFNAIGWNLTKRGIITIIAIIIFSAMVNIGLIFPSEFEFESNYECIINTPFVYHPFALKIWTLQVFILVNTNVILLIWLGYQLKKTERRTNLLLNTNKLTSANPTENITAITSGNAEEIEGNNTSTANRSKTAKMNKKRLSSAHLTILSASFYTLCYGPYVFAITTYTHCPNNCGIDNVMIKRVSTIVCLHGLLNSVIYVLKNKEFRKAFLETFSAAKKIHPTQDKE